MALRHLRGRHAARQIAGITLTTAVLVAGCSSRKNRYIAPIPAPKPPEFMNGPMALLLTNAGGFRANVMLEAGTPARQVAAGELMGKGGHLLFAPTLSKEARKQPLAGGFAFIWDVNGNHGYLLNDPLQAYSLCSPSLHFTNITVRPTAAKSAPESIAGHRCQPANAIVTATDGSLTAFRLWQATDLNGLPLRIVCTSANTPLTLNLSKPRLESLPDDLFQPPSGFTKYNSAEALVSELTARRNSLNRRPPSSIGELEPGTGWDTSPVSRR